MNRAEQEQSNSDDLDLKIGPSRSGQDRRAGGLREVHERATELERLSREPPRPGTELASYRVSSGERLLICAAGKGGLEIHDVPADFLGETYRVDRALEDEPALWAVVEDYLAQAKKLDAPPMSSEAMRTLMLKRDD